MEGEEYWPSSSSVSSSLEEPLLELANMNMSPQPKLVAEFFFTISVAQASGRQASQPERRYGKKCS